ncbi:MAG: VWA domain-containing protein [Candidatus Peribacteria bacterium]|nr:VWA domain-containing protein [Candidatus Peribacteria bacterium]
MFVLDVSKSMNVFDIFSNNSSYNRLEFAKKAISDFITNNSENRYSLVIFA